MSGPPCAFVWESHPMIRLRGSLRLILCAALPLGLTTASRPQPPADATPPVKSKQVRLDGDGEPLPPGARARLGTRRLRGGGRYPALAFLPDGKTLLSQGSYGHTVHRWDLSTGKALAPLV